VLKIRLTRTGKRTQESFRVVVADQKRAVKGKYLENLGHYNPYNKDLVIETDKVTQWISKGAQPTDTVASLLKRKGMSGMEKYIKVKAGKKKSKKGGENQA